MPCSHPLDPDAIVDVGAKRMAHSLMQEGEFGARNLAECWLEAFSETWTADPFDEDEGRLKRPPRTQALIYTHRLVRARDGFPCKVVVQLGRRGARLAFLLEGASYDDAFRDTAHVRPRPLGPIDIELTRAQFDGAASDREAKRFRAYADAVWSRVLSQRARRGAGTRE